MNAVAKMVIYIIFKKKIQIIKNEILHDAL